MAEKTYDSPVKERFEFVLSINGNIICQRYFGINNFQERSLGSVNLSEAVRACMALIDRDLKEKTDIYNYYTAPQVFKDKAEMEWWVKNQPFKLDVPGFAVLRDTEEVFTWNGTEMQPYNKPFNSELGEIMFPSDPTAHPANVYNCRCRMLTIYPEYRDEQDDWRESEIIDGQTYEEWKKGKKPKGAAN